MPLTQANPAQKAKKLVESGAAPDAPRLRELAVAHLADAIAELVDAGLDPDTITKAARSLTPAPPEKVDGFGPGRLTYGGTAAPTSEELVLFHGNDKVAVIDEAGAKLLLPVLVELALKGRVGR